LKNVAEVRKVEPFEYELVPIAPDKVNRNWEDIKIDYQHLVNMLSIGLTRSDIAFTLGCSIEALEKRVVEDHKDRGFTFTDLERWYKGMYIRQIVLQGQIKAAKDGEWKALEWLGKNYLGQTPEGIKSSGALSGTPIHELIKIATADSDNISKYANIKNNKLPTGEKK
jgi:hypothetical protein